MSTSREYLHLLESQALAQRKTHFTKVHSFPQVARLRIDALPPQTPLVARQLRGVAQSAPHVDTVKMNDKNHLIDIRRTFFTVTFLKRVSSVERRGLNANRALNALARSTRHILLARPGCKRCKLLVIRDKLF